MCSVMVGRERCVQFDCWESDRCVECDGGKREVCTV